MASRTSAKRDPENERSSVVSPSMPNGSLVALFIAPPRGQDANTVRSPATKPMNGALTLFDLPIQDLLFCYIVFRNPTRPPFQAPLNPAPPSLPGREPLPKCDPRLR